MLKTDIIFNKNTKLQKTVTKTNSYKDHFNLNTVGAAQEPCYETYRGINATSERETQALVRYWKNLGRRLKGWVTIHTYGQMLMNRWGYTIPPPSDEYYKTVCVFNIYISLIDQI